jgi:DNA-directed RNA polymerase subunit F
MDVNILEERPITMIEMREKLKEIEKRDKELNFRSNKTKNYLDTLTQVKEKEVEKTRKAILDLGLPRLKDRHLVKLLDILPEDLDSLKILFAGENLTLGEEDLQKLLKAVQA